MQNNSQSTAWLSRRDGSVIIGHGPFEASSSPPENEVAFYVQDFALSSKKPWNIPARCELLASHEFASFWPTSAPLHCDWASLEASRFSVIFQEIMSCIHGGIFEKTVPVVTESGIATSIPGPAIIAAMSKQSAPLHSYGWVGPDGGFAGATPELLFSLNDSRLETMALAGTAKSEDREVFAVDEKEIREHEYVAQTLVSKLADLGHVERLPREILDLGPIVHFLTTIGLNLSSPLSAENLLKRLHPTPALGPLPRTDQTLAKLFSWRALLGCPEEFGAPFGLWDNGRFDAIVAIRGIWWNGHQLRLPAGCGIIEASRLVNEWRELRLKREAVKRFLQT
jgi:menaquinone-specific isochorismate synthase